MKRQDSVENSNADPFKDVHSEKKSGGARLFILIALIGFAVIAIAFLYYKKNIASDSHSENIQDAIQNPVNTNSGLNEIIFQELDEIIVNLDTNTKNDSFLKVKITLELEDKGSLEAVNKLMPKINDTLLVYLKTLKPNDLRGSIGIYRLREELMIRLNKIITPGKIIDVLFKDFIMQ